jgi:hypothetical protein
VSFEESALTRLRRSRGETNVSLELVRETEEAARRFSGWLFGGLGYTAALGREACFEVETAHEKVTFALRVPAGPSAGAAATFGLLAGAAAETDEDLMHEEVEPLRPRPIRLLGPHPRLVGTGRGRLLPNLRGLPGRRLED